MINSGTFEDKEKELKEKISRMPDKPGVYLMKNKHRKIIYVGKAVSLKKRVRSYFSGDKDIKTRILVSKIDDIEIVLTETEYEAFLLENNLIKQWKPKYNINLKDGKTYPVIRITNETYPRVFRTRRIILDGSEYYGPYPNVQSIDDYLKAIEALYPLRKCKGRLKKRPVPCLYYHINRCAAPCCGKTTPEEYAQKVESIKKLLSGQTRELIKGMREEMTKTAEKLEFEKAAQIRDRLKALEHFDDGRQKVVGFKEEDRDYIGFAAEGIHATFVLFQVREGKMVGQERFHIENYSSQEEALRQFVIQYYSQIPLAPPLVHLPYDQDLESLSQFGKDKPGNKITFTAPQKGKHRKLILLAEENAREDVKEQLARYDKNEALGALKDLLGLPDIPRRIEGFDISHMAGKNTVAAMVSFFEGRPDKKNYRYFKIRSLKEGMIDDFESIKEGVARRYTRLLNEQTALPDLILIDGGKGQLNGAKEILNALGLDEQPIIGLAKKFEEVFLPGQKEPLIIPKTSPALRLLQWVRDESHRFGITLIRRLTRKELINTLFEEVKGIGKKKSNELILSFGSPLNVLNASDEEIARTVKITPEKAAELKTHIREALKDMKNKNKLK